MFFLSRNQDPFSDLSCLSRLHLLAVHAGWRDAELGAPWPKEHPDWPPELSIAYEIGRFVYHNIRQAGLPVPAWDGSREGAAAVQAAARGAKRMVGEVTPRPLGNRLVWVAA